MLVIVNVRLGADLIDPYYASLIKKYMRLPSFAGMVGGQPRKAFYFFGFSESEDRLLFLDPHVVHRYHTHSTEEGVSENLRQSDPAGSGARYICSEKLDPCLGFGYFL